MAENFIHIDSKDLATAAAALGVTLDQIPYAISVTLNEAAKDTRMLLANDTWPRHVKVRNPGFMRSTLHTLWASKTHPTVTIYDSKQRVPLGMYAEGRGTIAARSGSLAVPSSTNVAPYKTARGVPSGLRPRALLNSYRRGDVIFQRQKVGKKSRLALMYVLAASVKVRRHIPFYQDFEKFMTDRIADNLPGAVEKAMSTATSRTR